MTCANNMPNSLNRFISSRFAGNGYEQLNFDDARAVCEMSRDCDR